MNPYQSVLKATPNRTWRVVPLLLLVNACCSSTPLEYRPNEQLVAKKTPRFSFRYALNLSNPAAGQSLWPICKPFGITVFLLHRTSALSQRAIRKEAFPPASCTGSANETTIVVAVLASAAAKVTGPFGTITCSAPANLTSLLARPTKGLPLPTNLEL